MSLWRNNNLSITLFAITIILLVAMFLTGWTAYSKELAEHGQGGIGALRYLGSGHFLSTVFENWESEFLEKAAYVALTAFLIQRGSAESKDPDSAEESEEGEGGGSDVPWPLRGPAWISWLYSYSLGIALTLLFLLTIWLHLTFSWEKANADAALHNQVAVGYWEHLSDAEFWFESFQNWQSEFLSTGALVILSIFLRFRGSPESKHITSPNSETGR